MENEIKKENEVLKIPSENINIVIDKELSNEKNDENKAIKLRGRKKVNNKEIEKKIIKKFNDIPIIIHNSEKPSITLEENSAGKIFPSLYTFNYDKEYTREKNNRKCMEATEASEDLEKPIITLK